VSASDLRRVESYLAGSAGSRLFHRAWLPPDPPERVLLLIHGFAEHSGRYEAVGSWFAGRGSAVHAYDHRGHGRSGGRRGHVAHFSELLDDLGGVLEAVGAEHPGLPIYLVGHSMGGLVLAAFLRERRPAVAGAVSSGAALALAERMPRGQLAVARLLRRVTPRLALDAGLDTSALSRDPEVARRYEADPLVFRRLSVSLAVEMFDAAARTAGGGADIHVPMLLLHGAEDRLCPPRGSRELHATLKASGSALRLYPGLRHEIFNEPEAEDVFRDILEWLRERES